MLLLVEHYRITIDARLLYNRENRMILYCPETREEIMDGKHITYFVTDILSDRGIYINHNDLKDFIYKGVQL
jgi:HKD family nuclease